MKDTIAAIFLLIAALLIGIGGVYVYTELDSEVCFYVDLGDGEEEYCKVNIDGKTVSLTLPNDPTREGYTFGGWYLDNGTFNQKYTDDYLKSALKRDISLYAKWIPIGPCAHSETKISTINPTCKTAGRKDTICVDCNKKIDTEVIAALGHTPDEATEEKRVDATCMKSGSVDVVVYCRECNSELSRTRKTIDIVDHAYSGELAYSDVGDKMVFSCSVKCVAGCDYSQTFEDVKVVRSVAKEPTCIVEGAYLYSYTFLEDTFTCTSPIPKSSHKIGDVLYDDVARDDGAVPYDIEGLVLTVGQLTCGGTANASYTCSVCEQLCDVVAYRSHVGDWQIVEDATCYKQGLREIHNCTNCGEDGQEIIDKLDHSYEWTLTPDLQYEDFALVGVCNAIDCGSTVINEYIGYPTEKLISESTCTVQGSILYSCKYDGVRYTHTRYLQTKEHKLERNYISELVDENGRLAITIDGVYYFGKFEDLVCDVTCEGYYICKVCNEGYSCDVYLPHDWSDWTVITEADCMNTGEKTRKCNYCNVSETVYPSALDHSYDDYSLEYDNNIFKLLATCTAGCMDTRVEKEDVTDILSSDIIIASTCKTNGVKRYTYVDYNNPKIVCTYNVDMPLSDHSLDSHLICDLLDENGKLNVTENPGLSIILFGSSALSKCMTDYKGYYICDTCDNAFSITVYKEHDFGEWEIVTEATDTEEGLRKRTCTHGDCGFVEEDVILPGEND